MKSKKLSVTIPKRNLTKFSTVESIQTKLEKEITSSKMLASAQRDIDVARERGMSLREVLTHDILPNSILFDGEFTTSTPYKSKLVTQLEKDFPQNTVQMLPESDLKTVVLLDFMSKVRQFPKLISSTNVGTVVKKVVNAGIKSAPSPEIVHVILDSYKDESVKEGERRRRADDVGSVEQYDVEESTPVPQ